MKFYDEPFDALIKTRLQELAGSQPDEQFLGNYLRVLDTLKANRVFDALAAIERLVDSEHPSLRRFAGLGAVIADHVGSRAHLAKFIEIDAQQGRGPGDWVRFQDMAPEAIRTEAEEFFRLGAEDPSSYLIAADLYEQLHDLEAVVRVYAAVERDGLFSELDASSSDREMFKEQAAAEARLAIARAWMGSDDLLEQAMGYEMVGEFQTARTVLDRAQADQLRTLLRGEIPARNSNTAMFNFLLRRGDAFDALENADTMISTLVREIAELGRPEQDAPDPVRERLTDAVADLQLRVGEYYLVCRDQPLAKESAQKARSFGRDAKVRSLDIRADAIVSPAAARRTASRIEDVSTRSEVMLDLGEYLELQGDHTRAIEIFGGIPNKNDAYRDRLASLAYRLTGTAQDTSVDIAAYLERGVDVQSPVSGSTARSTRRRAADLCIAAADNHTPRGVRLLRQAAFHYAAAGLAEPAKNAHGYVMSAVVRRINNDESLSTAERRERTLRVVRHQTRAFTGALAGGVAGREGSEAAADVFREAGEITNEAAMFGDARRLYEIAGNETAVEQMERRLETAVVYPPGDLPGEEGGFDLGGPRPTGPDRTGPSGPGEAADPRGPETPQRPAGSDGVNIPEPRPEPKPKDPYAFQERTPARLMGNVTRDRGRGRGNSNGIER